MKKNQIVQSCMHKYVVSFLVYLSFFHPTSSTTSNSTDNPSDKILLNCGSSGTSSTFNGVEWTGDVGSNFLPPSYDTKSSTFFISNPDCVPKIPYLNARLILSSFTYSFPFSPGLKFIRFYFLSTSYLGLNPSKAYFSVQTGSYTLLNDFSPSVVAEELKSVYFTKDFLVNVKGNRLTITFTPSPVISGAVAFVNGIEIFSVPYSIYFSGANAPLPFLGHLAPFFMNDEYALEMLYRVNVGLYVHIAEVENVFGSWLDDLSYISSSTFGSIIDNPYDIVTYNSSVSKDYHYAAPEELYWSARTMGSNSDINIRYNLTWSFQVDSGFKYLVRLHFCEISSDVRQANQRVFIVYINNQTAEERMDLIALTGKPLVTLYRDYVVMVPMNSGRTQDLLIGLHPNIESNPKYADAILNGIEIIKLSDSSKNLAASILLKSELRGKKIPLNIFGATSGALLVLFITSFILIRRSQKKGKWGPSRMLPLNSAGKSREVMQLAMNSDHCFEFTFAEVRRATHDFSQALVIGEGGFGKVYKGFIREGGTIVAIKRCNHQSRQGVREFQNEINLLSTFHHMNLVSLLGYCHEDSELILVYEYMAQGTLRDHLKTQKQTLPWIQRLQICIDAARGLHYLHTGKSHRIIHRDVKSANILLDHNLVAKISDFGLSKIGSSSTSHNHVSTEVKGTFGYLDPEYYRNRKLTEKSDVYSFGVVLFEVLSGRPAVNPFAVEEEGEKVGLVEWAFHCHLSGTIHRMVVPHLDGKIKAECLSAFVDIGIKCLADKSIDRPTMAEVLSNLEKILSLQESWDEKETNGEQPVHEIGVNEEITTNEVDGEHHLNEIMPTD